MKPFRDGWATGRRYFDNPLLRKLIGNAGWLLADRIGRLGLGVVILAWTARYLGPGDFGLLSYAQAIVVLVTSVAQFGLTDVVIRDIVRHPDRGDIIISTALAIRIAMGVVSIGLSCLVAHLFRPGDELALVVTLALSVSLLFQAGEVLEYDLQARNSVAPAVAARSAAFLICNAVKIVGLLTGAGLFFFAVMIAVEAAVTALLFLFANRDGRRLASIRHLSRTEARYLASQAAPLFLRTAAIAFYMRLDQILISQFYGDAATGIYAAAVRLVEVWFFAPIAIMTALVPTLASAYLNDQQVYRRQLKQAMRILVYGSFAFALVASLLAGPIISLFYGTQYEGAVAILRIYAWSAVFGTLGLATNAWFVNSGLMRYAFHQALIGLIFNAGLNVVLIGMIGPIGGAIAYVVSQIMTNYLLNAVFAATRPVFWLQTEVLTLR